MAIFLLIIAVVPVKIRAPWASFALNTIFREREVTFGVILCHILDVPKVGIEKWCLYAVSSITERDGAGRAMEVCADLTVLYEEIGNGAAATILDSSERNMRALEL